MHSPKLCKDCKWHRKMSYDVYDLCYHPANGTSLADGEVIVRKCNYVRTNNKILNPEGICGPDGALFEPKESVLSFFDKLKNKIKEYFK